MRDVLSDVCGELLQFQWQDVPVVLQPNQRQRQYATFNNKVVPANVAAYHYEINIAEMQRTDPAIRQKRAQDVLSLVADGNIQQLAAQEGYQISVVTALEDLLDELGRKNIDKYLVPRPDPHQIQIQQAEAENKQMVQTGDPAEVTANDDHQTHIQIHYPISEDVPAATEHIAEHYAWLEAAQAAGLQQGQAAAVQSKAGGLRPGPARATPTGIGAKGDEQIEPQAAAVG